MGAATAVMPLAPPTPHPTPESPRHAQLTIAVAGDVQPAQIRRLAEKYFGGWRAGNAAPAGPACGAAGGGADEPLPLPAGVPEEAWEYRAQARAGPAVLHAYYRPCIRSPDSVPLDLARCGTRQGGWRAAALCCAMLRCAVVSVHVCRKRRKEATQQRLANPGTPVGSASMLPPGTTQEASLPARPHGAATC